MAAPTILAFDTSAAHCAAVLVTGGAEILRVEEMDKGQAERLLPFLEELLTSAGLVWRDLDAIGVGVGPGNFTGIRIATSAARGLALGLGIPAIGVSGFDAIAADAPRPLAAEIPAPRGQFYRQVFTADGAEAPELLSGDTTPLHVPRQQMPAAEDFIRRIARIAVSRFPGYPAKLRPAPLYVRGADAAPARDLPPPILQ